MGRASAAEMRRIEQLAVEQGDSFARLMEMAGESCADWLRRQPDWLDGEVTIVCGRGNNGGDGFVLARQLWRQAAAVTVVLAQGAPTAQPAMEQYQRLLTLCDAAGEELVVLDWTQEPYLCSAAVRQAAVVVDCLYGIGFHGELPAILRPLLERMNSAEGHKVAVDMPSGLPADGGAPDEDAFRAEHTLTFTTEKLGQDHPLCGQVTVLDIGIPAATVEQVLGQHIITPALVAGCFRPRPVDSHKGTFGRLLTVCGSYGMAGAALLCVRGALRSGAGLVTAAVPRSVYPLLAAAIPEAVFLPLPETEGGQFAPEATAPLQAAVMGATAVVCGCGIGPEQTPLVTWLCRYSTRPVILDADGINAITPHILTEETVSAPLILTPHPGEMARLLDIPVPQLQRHRAEIARRFADDYGVTLVLKGHHTLVTAPGRPLLCNETGNPGMATGGSGDVLAGIIGSLAAQGMDPYHAAVCGVYLHGAAGDRAAARLSQHSMLPTDLIEELGDLFLQFEK